MKHMVFLWDTVAKQNPEKAVLCLKLLRQPICVTQVAAAACIQE